MVESRSLQVVRQQAPPAVPAVAVSLSLLFCSIHRSFPTFRGDSRTFSISFCSLFTNSKKKLCIIGAKSQKAASVCESDCSCSCSGGDCSCSEDEDVVKEREREKVG